MSPSWNVRRQKVERERGKKIECTPTPSSDARIMFLSMSGGCIMTTAAGNLRRHPESIFIGDTVPSFIRQISTERVPAPPQQLVDQVQT